MNKIIDVTSTVVYGYCTMTGVLEDGSTERLFSYYTDELSFGKCELIGLTPYEAKQLYTRKDVAYLRS